MDDVANALRTVDWTGLVKMLSALLTPVIALLAAYIAFQQYKTNKNQFRLALLERRLKVFNSAGEVIGTVLRHPRIEAADLQKFLWETRESDFLFGADITAYLHELYEKAVDVQALGDLPPNEIHRQDDVARWFSGQGEEIKKKFGIYMAFKDSDRTGVNIRRGFNRLYIVFAVLWSAYFLLIFPALRRNDAFKQYQQGERICQSSPGPLGLDSCLELMKQNYEVSASRWTGTAFYLILWPLMVLPVGVLYVCCHIATWLGLWVCRGFRVAT